MNGRGKLCNRGDKVKRFRFRVWDKKSQVMEYDDLGAYCNVDIGMTLCYDDCVLMQCTGLKDKNGVDIFEGDIVVAHTFDEDIDKKQVGEVAYHNERCGYIFIPKELKNKNLYYPLFAIVTCELIGNVYENQELLTS